MPERGLLGRGLVVGFLGGVLLTLIAAGVTGWYIYQSIQKKLSAENTQQMVESRMRSLLGSEVAVGSAVVTLPNLITLERISLTSDDTSLLSIDKVEAAAEGGVTGLTEGRFVEVILTNPVVNLVQTEGGSWNLSKVLDPLLARSIRTVTTPTQVGSGELSSATKLNTPATSMPLSKRLPLKNIQLKNLQVSLTIENTHQHKLRIGDLMLTRKDVDSSWSLTGKECAIQLATLSGKTDLVTTFNSLVGLVPSLTTAASPGGQGEKTPPQASSPPWLAGFRLEQVSLEVIDTQQNLSIEGITLSADELFEVIRIQSDQNEKKNLQSI
jgi:hypothetical protein